MPTLDDAATEDDPTATPTTDGRRRRSERSRAAIAQAMLDLLRAGDPAPSSAAIARRAGVTQRTLFNQFGDMGSLIRAVVALQAERVVGQLPTAGTGTATERLDRFTDQLAHLLEDTMHVRWAVVTTAEPSPALSDGVRAAQAALRQRLESGFPDELARLDPVRRAEVLDAFDVVADPAVWRLSRVHHDRPEATCRAALRRAVADLLQLDA